MQRHLYEHFNLPAHIFYYHFVLSIYLFLLFMALLGIIIFLGYSTLLLFMLVALEDHFIKSIHGTFRNNRIIKILIRRG